MRRRNRVGRACGDYTGPAFPLPSKIKRNRCPGDAPSAARVGIGPSMGHSRMKSHTRSGAACQPKRIARIDNDARSNPVTGKRTLSPAPDAPAV